MHLYKPTVLAAWALVTLNLILAFGAIAMFMRMSPSIAEIIERNDHSLIAGEQMLIALARGVGPESESMFDAAFVIAENNITEAEERTALDLIAQLRPTLWAGDVSVMHNTITAVNQLLSINHKAMQAADLSAQRLGAAGAWGVVFMSMFSFIAGIIFIRRLNNQLLAPLGELVKVIAANRAGDQHRRCPLKTVDGDFLLIYSEVNGLLDESRWSETLIKDRLHIRKEA